MKLSARHLRGRRSALAARAVGLFLIAVPVLATACSSGPSGPRPFEVVTPRGSRISVRPGQTVQFQVRLDPGFTARYDVDGTPVAEGLAFTFTPIVNEHTVAVRFFGAGGELADVETFRIVVEVPGNDPPVILGVELTPIQGEAERDVFTARITASDPDGTVASIRVDWGDGSPASQGPGPVFEAEHTYPSPSTYTITILATDDAGVSVGAASSAVVIPRNQLPQGTLTVNGVQNGPPIEDEEPVTVVLATSGFDSDGSIVSWEIDTDQGQGFVPIQPNGSIQVEYDFREQPYVPVLRLTDDDGEAALIQAGVLIRVFRSIGVDTSSAIARGNPRFDGLAIAPAVFANGQDPFRVEIQVRDALGNPARDVPVRVVPLRPSFSAPNGATIGPLVQVQSGVRTGADGRAVVLVTTNTSTRVELVPQIGFQPFAALVEADRGLGNWVEIDRIEGLNGSAMISAAASTITVRRAGGNGSYCPGDLVEIRVDAVTRSDAPGAGGPSPDRYVEIRRSSLADMSPWPVDPGPGFGGWRTNANGTILFTYRPASADQARIVRAWVDGQTLDNFAAFNFGANCP